MKKPIKVLLLIFLSVACLSCAQNYVNSTIDINKLQNQKEKYGVVVFRSIYFKHGITHSFIGGNFISVVARRLSLAKSLMDYDYCISCRKHVDGKKIDWNQFLINPGDKSGLEILKPEAFYGVTLMPAGEYFIMCMLLDFNYSFFSESYLSLKNANKLHFYVKPGKINYIGDFYVTDSVLKKQGGIFSNDIYSSQNLILDRYQDAKNHMNKYYPEIKLPFSKGLIIDVSE